MAEKFAPSAPPAPAAAAAVPLLEPLPEAPRLVQPARAEPPPLYATVGYTADGYVVQRDAYGLAVAPPPPTGRWGWLRRAGAAIGRAAVRTAHWAVGSDAYIRNLHQNGATLRRLVEDYPLKRVARALGLDLRAILDMPPERRLSASWYRLSNDMNAQPFRLRAKDWVYLRYIGLSERNLPALFGDVVPSLDDLLMAGLRPLFLRSIHVDADWLLRMGALTPAVLQAVFDHSRATTHYPPLYLADWHALGVTRHTLLRQMGLTDQQVFDLTGIHPARFSGP